MKSVVSPAEDGPVGKFYHWYQKKNDTSISSHLKETNTEMIGGRKKKKKNQKFGRKGWEHTAGSLYNRNNIVFM